MKLSVTPQKLVLSALGLGLLLPSVAHSAAIVYSTDGAAYTQNFNTLGTSSASWTNGETLTGWHWIRGAGATPSTFTTPATYTAANGGTAVGDQVLSLGNSTDRAFGGQNTNDIGIIYYGAQILNSTGDTLDTFTLTYTGEQWRMIQNEVADRLTFQYQIFDAGEGSLSAASGWNAVGDLTFIAPRTTTSSSSSLDGNAEGNRVESISATVSALTWSEGQEIWLRWADNNPVNNNALGGSTRAIIGIDDVIFSANSTIPEPSSYAVIFGVLSLGFASCLRRRPHAAK